MRIINWSAQRRTQVNDEDEDAGGCRKISDKHWEEKQRPSEGGEAAGVLNKGR